MFSKYQDDKTREWNNAIERYISLHKYMKEVGKIGISQARSGQVNHDVQSKLVDALTQIDKALSKLKEFFRPCLTDVDTTNIFPEEKATTEMENLTQEISKLKHENEYLQQQLSEQYHLRNGGDGIEIRDLQQELSLNHQVYERKRQIFLQGKQDLQQKVVQLSQEIQKLRSAFNPLSVGEGVDGKKGFEYNNNEKSQIKHQQLEETLKAQNDLIYDLKQQLADSIRERQMFRRLNKDLEGELQKKTRAEVQQSEKEILGDGIDLEDDYFNRSTLKINEYNSQTENFKEQKLLQDLHKDLQFENRMQNYRPKFKSLEDIPVAGDQKRDKIYLKSKSYDFTNGERTLHENLLKFQNKAHNIHEKEHSTSKQNDHKETQYLTEHLEKISEEEKINYDDKSQLENVVN